MSVRENVTLEASRVLVVNDAHLGQDLEVPSREREARLVSLLREKAPEADLVVLLGDIFDFWFEYRRAIPRRFFPLLATLYHLARTTRVVFVEGNHDLWMEDFFPEELGIPVVREGVDLDLSGVRVRLVHGDLLDGLSLGGKTTRKVLGHPLLKTCFRWIHPDVGIALAHGVARLSRSRSDHEEVPEERLVEGARRVLEEGYNLLVMGHLHQVLARKVGEGYVLVTGDWMRHFTYGWLEPDRFEVRRFPSHEVVARLP